MIAPAKRPRRVSKKTQEKFRQMLPQIEGMARAAFRDRTPELRAELAAEVVARAYVAFVRLARQGRATIAYATPLALFAIKQVKSGRRVAARSNVRDVCSQQAQMEKRVVLKRLDHYDDESGDWRAALIEDRRAGPAEIVATRLDVAAWLRTLSPHYRRIAIVLAGGETTRTAARQFGVTPSRISQIRRQLRNSWEAFLDESKTEEAA